MALFWVDREPTRGAGRPRRKVARNLDDDGRFAPCIQNSCIQSNMHERLRAQPLGKPQPPLDRPSDRPSADTTLEGAVTPHAEVFRTHAERHALSDDQP